MSLRRCSRLTRGGGKRLSRGRRDGSGGLPPSPGSRPANAGEVFSEAVEFGEVGGTDAFGYQAVGRGVGIAMVVAVGFAIAATAVSLLRLRKPA